MVQVDFVQLAAPVNAVQDLQILPVLPLVNLGFQPVHKAVGFFGESDAEQRVEGKGGVPDPGIAVVPVALAPQFLGQAASGGGHNGAGGFIGQQLQRQGGTLHHFPPAPPVGALAQPPPPVGHGFLKEGFAFGGSRRVVIGGVIAQHSHGNGDRVAFGQGESPHHAVAGGVFLQQDAGGELQPQPVGYKGGAVFVEFNPVFVAGVVEGRIAFQDERHYAAHAVDPAD